MKSKPTTFNKIKIPPVFNEETFVDIEKGSPYSKEEKNDSISEGESNVSVSYIYDATDTNAHFFQKLSSELDKIKAATKQPMLIEPDLKTIDEKNGNSPLTLSVCSSVNDSDFYDSDSEENDSTTFSKHRAFKRITYEDIETTVDKYYNKELQISSELDILLTYLKGQCHIFKQANRITSQKFYMLMFPAIFLTGTMTVVAPFMKIIGWSGYVFSVLNALLTVMITINNFMKWQAVAAIYLSISNQFDKLGVSVEMTRNQIVFVENSQERHTFFLDKMRETEKRIMDIQFNFNDIVIPYEIQLLNPIISHINIFSFIKKIAFHKKSLILKYRDIKNEIRYIMYRWGKKGLDTSSSVQNLQKQEEIDKLQSLLKQKEETKVQLMENNSNNVYAYIDNLFIREIQHSEHYYTYNSVGMYLIRPPSPLERFSYGNSMVDEYLNFIFINPKD